MINGENQYMSKLKSLLKNASLLSIPFVLTNMALASEADLIMPTFNQSETNLLYFGLLICFLGIAFGIYKFFLVKNLKAHKSMLEVADLIYETAKTYMMQQAKFILLLEILIGTSIFIYFFFLQHQSITAVALILLSSLVGIIGSFSVAYFGIRVNTLANSRMAFASLENKPLKLLNIPLQAGMSIGILLIAVELVLLLAILLFIPSQYAGSCFIGFAIGESLGASALRIAGGIFTKIADIGSDLMKIVFNLKEDDPSNPGVIADCTGDNAGDSVGPTADGFETFGVTTVALLSFVLLSVFPAYQTKIIVWMFMMNVSMLITSLLSYYINHFFNKVKIGEKKDIDFEAPLTSLVWITSLLSIGLTFVTTYFLLSDVTLNGRNDFWLWLSVIISIGTFGAAVIPEFTKVFTSTKALHTKEVVIASREGGASLTILSGLNAGNFSAFWKGMVFFGLMFAAFWASNQGGLSAYMGYPAVFAFGLVAFGFLSMGPVTIAVDSYGPVTDNAQSIYELSLIEELPNIENEIEKDFGFKPDFTHAKQYLEENDGAGNTFKATSKPVLIGTAVVGATTMIFSLILFIEKSLNADIASGLIAQGTNILSVLSLINPYTIFGLLCGGAVIYWFTGSSMQAVTTGSYQAVEFIKKNIDLNNTNQAASIENSKKVVEICTRYAQKGMFNIFIGIFCFTLAFAFFSAPQGANYEPTAFFISYLLSIAVFGLYQAMFMANAGGCWDNAKKIVETELKQKGTPLHAATVIGDTVGDPFKDTSSVALNPVIKFTTLFGILAMEMALVKSFSGIAPMVGIAFLSVGLYFVWRSFYKMRIPDHLID
jgi:K(+)-stimulated pyrophosphate-energized sodium pump